MLAEKNIEKVQFFFYFVQSTRSIKNNYFIETWQARINKFNHNYHYSFSLPFWEQIQLYTDFTGY